MERHRGVIFSEGADSLFNKLDQAAESVGMLLQVALNELAEKVSAIIYLACWYDVLKHGLTIRSKLVCPFSGRSLKTTRTTS